jgi:ADP-heptose:LPS heptosyltransferase
MLPTFEQPRWTGQDLKDKIILVVGEQGHGDNIQFARFLANLHEAGAKIKLQVTEPVVSLMKHSICTWTGRYDQDPGEFDYWIPIMSVPGVLGSTLGNLPSLQNYLSAEPELMQQWQQRLGPKKRMRVGFAWSGRRDNWVNAHKGMPLESMLELIRNNPQFEWISLQADATPADDAKLDELGVTRFPGLVSNFADTAALMMHIDVVLTVDTAVAHLAGALGRPTWIMLCQFAVDWRWLLERDSSPWYSTARLFRQPKMGDWESVTKKVSQYLGWFKV